MPFSLAVSPLKLTNPVKPKDKRKFDSFPDLNF